MNILKNRECTFSIAICNGINTLFKQSSLLSDIKDAQNISCIKPDLKYRRLQNFSLRTNSYVTSQYHSFNRFPSLEPKDSPNNIIPSAHRRV